MKPYVKFRLRWPNAPFKTIYIGPEGCFLSQWRVLSGMDDWPKCGQKV